MDYENRPTVPFQAGIPILNRKYIMSKNTKQTSSKLATLAAETLSSQSSSAIAKSFAASALSQTGTDKQTSAEMEAKAGMVLQSSKYSDDTKALAASVLSQSNKSRGE